MENFVQGIELGGFLVGVKSYKYFDDFIGIMGLVFFIFLVYSLDRFGWIFLIVF